MWSDSCKARERRARSWLALTLSLCASVSLADDGPGKGDASAPAVCAGRLGTSRVIPINPVLQPIHIGLKTYPQTLALADHEVVLTFDDGPDRDTTPAVLAALEAECVRVTFFVVGRHAAALPDLVRRELSVGHTVGHHSLSHPATTLRGLDEAAATAEIDQGVAAVELAAYGAAAAPPAHPHVPFFRFPGFADTPALLALLDKRHVAVFGTDLWVWDWLNPTPAQELSYTLTQLEHSARHSGVLLFHDDRRSTAAMLPALLRELHARGYRIVHITPAQHGSKQPTPLTQVSAKWTSETEQIIAHALPRLHPAAGSAARP